MKVVLTKEQIDLLKTVVADSAEEYSDQESIHTELEAIIKCLDEAIYE